MNEAWERLKTLSAKRQEKLYGAHEIQHFNRYGEIVKSLAQYMTVVSAVH